MRSLISLTILLGIFLSYSQATVTEEQLQEVMKVVMDCAIKEKATQDDLDELFKRKLPTSRTAKCLHACISEHFGVLKNNKLDVEIAVEMGKMKFDNDPDKVQIIRDIVNDCSAVTDVDRCESAAKICRCVHEAAISRKLIFDI